MGDVRLPGKTTDRVLEGRPRNGAFAFRKSCPRLAFMRGSISGQHAIQTPGFGVRVNSRRGEQRPMESS